MVKELGRSPHDIPQPGYFIHHLFEAIQQLKTCSIDTEENLIYLFANVTAARKP